MEDESNAWYAAQRVNECAQGIENVCDLIEREISGTNRRGYTEWYLEHAYRIFLENGAFDTEAFIRDFHDVFRPGETEAEARSRRGEVDLSVLGRPGRRPEPDEEEVEPEPKPEATPEPEPEPEPEPAPEPGPEPETPEPEGELQTVAILVGRDQGNLVYMATDDVPQAVQSGVEVAANEVLGPAGNFDQNDQVGTVTVRGTDVVDIDLSEGRRILELMRIEGVGEVSEERAIEDFRQEIRERLD